MSNRKERRSTTKTTQTFHTDEKSGHVQKIRVITAKNEEQKYLIQQIYQNDFIVICGKAGSGKTYISCGLAAEYLKKGLVEKIIITRACVGPEDLGFLPGEIDAKIGPYADPIIIQLSYFLDVQKEINKGTIQILPIAYMRGHTFNNAFVILDEGQNVTKQQLKMFVTRIGENSKIIIAADVNQSDLDNKHNKDFSNFLKYLTNIATNENGIAIITLLHSVRHRLVEILLNIFEVDLR